MYTCQVSRLRRDCHACRSKTCFSRLLTPVFQFVMPGRNVWAITALTDTFWKYINYLNKPEPKREKKSLCGWSTFSEFSFFSNKKSMFLSVPVFVLDGTLRNIFGSLQNIVGHLWILWDPYEKSLHSYDKKMSRL